MQATDFIISSTGGRHPLWLANGEKAGQVQAYVDYGVYPSWNIEGFWPAADRGLKPGEMMDQNVLTVTTGICSRDGAAPTQLKSLVVATENQYRCFTDGKSYIDTSSDYKNAVFAPAELELGQHDYRSFGTVVYTKHDTPFATPQDPARQIPGKFEYLITTNVSQDESGVFSVTLLEEFWQAMQDTDPAGYQRGNRGTDPWGYRRFQRYDKNRGLVFLHDLQAGWIAKRAK